MSTQSHKSPPPPCAIVIFGASGDLTKRLIIPALYNLARTGLLPARLALVGVGHSAKTSEQWRDGLREFLEQVLAKTEQTIDEKLWQAVSQHMTFLTGDFEKPETYTALDGLLGKIDKELGLDGNALFFLATANHSFATFPNNLG